MCGLKQMACAFPTSAIRSAPLNEVASAQLWSEERIVRRCTKHLTARVWLHRWRAGSWQRASKNDGSTCIVAYHPVLGIGRRKCALRGEGSKRGVGLVVDYRHRRHGCTEDKRRKYCDHHISLVIVVARTLRRVSLLACNRIRVVEREGYIRSIHDDVFEALQRSDVY